MYSNNIIYYNIIAEISIFRYTGLTLKQVHTEKRTLAVDQFYERVWLE